ncbi:hypothetical protein [Bradyrhizobium oligotrophicum]|uniref:hypothetical protein n=1 Tax=Bradyrhizobium oligotrophicum TaxID=44255 RepID=UPI003EB7EA12
MITASNRHRAADPHIRAAITPRRPDDRSGEAGEGDQHNRSQEQPPPCSRCFPRPRNGKQCVSNMMKNNSYFLD